VKLTTVHGRERRLASSIRSGHPNDLSGAQDRAEPGGVDLVSQAAAVSARLTGREGGDRRALEMQRALIRAAVPGDQQAEGSDGNDATQMLRPVPDAQATPRRRARRCLSKRGARVHHKLSPNHRRRRRQSPGSGGPPVAAMSDGPAAQAGSGHRESNIARTEKVGGGFGPQ
jgi:hypothetical protein